MKCILYLAIFLSVAIALYEMLFWIFESDLGLIITILSVISAFYGYVLLQILQKRKK